MAMLSCPKCSGDAAGSRGVGFWTFVVLLFPVSLIFLFLKEIYTCEDCGYKFKE